MNLKPNNDVVIFEPIEHDDQTKSGIYMGPSAGKEEPDFGRVVACGPGFQRKDGTREPMAVEVGDTIVVAKHSATPVEIESEDLAFIEATRILAVVEDEC